MSDQTGNNANDAPAAKKVNRFRDLTTICTIGALVLVWAILQ